MQENYLSASDALDKLKSGNLVYVKSKTSRGDISLQKRLYTSENGQRPYAVIIACSDSRVIPESIFSAGIGELFVVRVAGNVIDNHQLGSIEYAINNLGCRLVVVLGHTQCGAVGAAMRQNQGYIKFITDEIKLAIGEEVDPFKASILNIRRSVARIKASIKDVDGVQITGAIYHTDSGLVDFGVIK
ncbi:MAG: carbonic anhydrase [Clostridia bacterium]|nr:carbonic anhydrase [Clostridia bacterium]